MEHRPRVVRYIDWDIVLKCKSGKYASIDECLKSIWTEEYANPIEHYNQRTMIQIMGQVLEEILPIEQRAYLLDNILRSDRLNSQTELLNELYYTLQLLQVRGGKRFNGIKDLYIINRKGKYYTIEQYDKLKEENAND